MLEYLQRDLLMARAQIVRKDAEIEVLKEQNKEVTDELSWVLKDLLRFKKADVDDRCRTWLQSSQGLSTILASKGCAEKPPSSGEDVCAMSACICSKVKGGGAALPVQAQSPARHKLIKIPQRASMWNM